MFCSGKDRNNGASGVSHTNFRISAEHDTMVLSDSRGRILVDRVVIDNLAKDCSYGRDANGNWTVFQTATPGLPNNQTGMNQMDRNMIAMNSTGVYITEVMASDDSVAALGNHISDWVELYNSSQSGGGFKRLWPQRPDHPRPEVAVSLRHGDPARRI